LYWRQTYKEQNIYLGIIADNERDSRFSGRRSHERQQRLFDGGEYEVVVAGNNTRQVSSRLVEHRYVIGRNQLCLADTTDAALVKSIQQL